jgi:hypothetical protein
LNGRPDGLPRGKGVTPREAIPLYRCALTGILNAGSAREESDRICRRVIGGLGLRITTKSYA